MNDIFNFLQLDENLSCSGMPKPEQLREMAEADVKFVVNLATPKSEGWMPDEGGVIQSLGIEYLSIPVDWENPTAQDLARFLDAMAAHEGQRVHVHCQANFRATAFIGMYRVLRLGWDREKAFEEARKIWKVEEYPVWEKFVNESLQINHG
ncbi:MAG: protein tyrosine phosphatase family protein [Chloroflexota bacterium]